jgi:N-acetylmuramoyl-L-alanine amidase
MYMKFKRIKKFIPISMLLTIILTLGGFCLAQTYYVQPGDSLYQIATRYGTSVTDLQKSNQLGTTALYPGQTLQIGAPSGTSQNNTTHTVRAGDSLYLIAQRYKTSVEALQRANHLSGASLMLGQRLTIPAASAQGGTANYQVRAGDTLFLIAQRSGASLSKLLRLNHLTATAVIQPGQILKLPAKTSSGPAKLTLGQSDIDLLARLVSAEAAGEPFEGQVAVAATILNRLKDNRYPNTIFGVIYQINYGRYQYSPVLDGRIKQPATTSAYRAVETALTGRDPSNGANGFYNPVKTDNRWVQSQPITATIGDHVFFNY